MRWDLLGRRDLDILCWRYLGLGGNVVIPTGRDWMFWVFGCLVQVLISSDGKLSIPFNAKALSYGQTNWFIMMLSFRLFIGIRDILGDHDFLRIHYILPPHYRLSSFQFTHMHWHDGMPLEWHSDTLSLALRKPSFPKIHELALYVS